VKYILCKINGVGTPEIEITEEDYAGYKESRAVLVNCLAIEESYEVLISNYLSLEKCILCAAADSMVRVPAGYPDLFDLHLALNIHLVNLLTAARSYVDQLPRHVKKCVPHSSNATAVVESILSKEYDKKFEYRFMEALRNSAQHCSLPIHWTSQGYGWTDIDKNGIQDHSRLEYYIELAATKSLLKEDGAFSKKVLDESPDRIDLKVATRGYIESLSEAHATVRELIKEPVQKSRLMFQEAHNQYRSGYAESIIDLSACMIRGQEPVETIPLLLEWDDVRIKLQNRNGKLINLKKRNVTGKICTTAL
jgi:hypothetical protein